MVTLQTSQHAGRTLPDLLPHIWLDVSGYRSPKQTAETTQSREEVKTFPAPG